MTHHQNTIRDSRSSESVHKIATSTNQVVPIDTPSPDKRTLLGWGVVIALALAIGLLAEPPNFGGGRAAPRIPAPPPDLGRLLYQLGVGSITWYALVVAAPFLALGARRVDTARPSRPVVAAMVAGVIVACIALTAALQYWMDYRGIDGPSFAQYVPQVLRQGVLPWIALAGIIASMEARRRAQQQRLEQERLRAEVAEQRLLALTAQLHPHFLFNTLQGISTLIHRDPDAADELLAKLGDLLRDLLRHRDRAIVPLGDEIRYARTYLEVAKIRFGDRLRFEIDAPTDLHHASVPLFVLQPLVENALGHGIGARLEGGCITIRATNRQNRLVLEVEDNGAGLSGQRIKEGIGISNTRERLRATFGDDFTFALSPGTTGGTIAYANVPLRRAVTGQ